MHLHLYLYFVSLTLMLDTRVSRAYFFCCTKVLKYSENRRLGFWVVCGFDAFDVGKFFFCLSPSLSRVLYLCSV